MSISYLCRWAIDDALPIWGSAGFDATQQQFVEQLRFDGSPVIEAPRRVMVQARQIYAFGVAYERGWFATGGDLAERAYRTMVQRYGGVSDGMQGWAFAANQSGKIVDESRDLYAQAFVLLALATVRRLGGSKETLSMARNTLAFMDKYMAAPSGGYIEAFPKNQSPRRQNPHMHLLEALLAWHVVAPDEGFDARAAAVLDLLEQKFFVCKQNVGALVEYFDDELMPIGGPDFSFEPGHHFEWVWLINQCERLIGRGNAAVSHALWTSAVNFGFRSDGAIFDQVAMSGTVQKAGIRLWPLTEAIKAYCCQTKHEDVPRSPTCDDLAQTLSDNFLSQVSPGLWKDRFAEDGKLASDNVPASSFYHLCCALDQACEAGFTNIF